MAAIRFVRLKLPKPVELVVLGNAGGPGARKTLEELRAVAVVESAEGFLPQRDLIVKARSCAFLLAPLLSNKSYGSTRGTGVFGDAILSGVKVVVPTFVDPEQEFGSVCTSYEGTEGLAKVILNFSHAKVEAIGPETLDRYSSSSVRAAVFSQLGLQLPESGTRLHGK